MTISMSMDPYGEFMVGLSSSATNTHKLVEKIEDPPSITSAKNPTDNLATKPSLHSKESAGVDENMLHGMVTVDEVCNSDDSNGELVVVEETSSESKPQSPAAIEGSDRSLSLLDLPKQQIISSARACHTAPTSIVHSELTNDGVSPQLIPADKVSTLVNSSKGTSGEDILHSEKVYNQNMTLFKPSIQQDNAESAMKPQEPLFNSICVQTSTGKHVELITLDDIGECKDNIVPELVVVSSPECQESHMDNKVILAEDDNLCSNITDSLKFCGGTRAPISNSRGKVAEKSCKAVSHHINEADQEKCSGAFEVVETLRKTANPVQNAVLENEKEEGEITSEDEAPASVPLSKPSVRIARPTKRRLTRRSSSSRANSRKDKRPKRVSRRSRSKENPNDSYGKMLLEHTEQRKKAKAEDADSLRVLRIAALRSVAKATVPTKTTQATPTPLVAPAPPAAWLDSSNAEDIAKAVTELPTDSKIVKTPKTMLNRKKKWQAMAQKLSAKDDGEPVETDNGAALSDMDMSLDGSETANGGERYVQQDNLPSRACEAEDKQDITLDEVLHMSLSSSAMDLSSDKDSSSCGLPVLREAHGLGERRSYKRKETPEIRIARTSKVMHDIGNLGNPLHEIVVACVQISQKLVSTMTTAELRGEISEVSIATQKVREQIYHGKKGKGRTKKKTKLALLLAYKEKLQELLEQRQKQTAHESVENAVYGFPKRTEMQRRGSKMADILTTPDPKQQYDMFMSTVGDKHIKIPTPESSSKHLLTTSQSETNLLHAYGLSQSPYEGFPIMLPTHQPLSAVHQRLAAPPLQPPMPPRALIQSSAWQQASVEEVPPLREQQVTAQPKMPSESSCQPPDETANLDTELLRQQALKSIQRKAADATTTANKPTVGPKRVVTASVAKKKPPPVKDMPVPPMAPKMRQIIINLADDTSSDEEGVTTPMSAVPAGLDSMLKECREQVVADPAKQPIKQVAPVKQPIKQVAPVKQPIKLPKTRVSKTVLSPTSASIELLPPKMREEYRKLKEAVRQKTKLKQKQARPGLKGSPAVSKIGKKQLKSRTQAINAGIKAKASNSAHARAAAVIRRQSSSTVTSLRNRAWAGSSSGGPVVGSSTPSVAAVSSGASSTVRSSSTPSTATSLRAVSGIRSISSAPGSLMPHDTSSSTSYLASKGGHAVQPTQLEHPHSPKPNISLKQRNASLSPIKTRAAPAHQLSSRATYLADVAAIERDIKDKEEHVRSKKARLAVLEKEVQREKEALRTAEEDLSCLKARKQAFLSQTHSKTSQISHRHSHVKVGSPGTKQSKQAGDKKAAKQENHQPATAVAVETSSTESCKQSEILGDRSVPASGEASLTAQAYHPSGTDVSSASSYEPTPIGVTAEDVGNQYEPELVKGMVLDYMPTPISTPEKALASSKDAVETVKMESAETEAVKMESTETETVKMESTGTETFKMESTETETVKMESTETETVKMESAETETVKMESAEIETVKMESAETETVKMESAETETVKVKSTETEPVKMESTETEPVKMESAETETVKVAGCNGSEEKPKMSALERAMNIKLRSKNKNKKLEKVSSNSGDLIPVPKLATNALDQLPPKRRRSFLEPPSPKKEEKSIKKSASELGTLLGPLHNRQARGALLEELQIIPQMVKQLRSEFERLGVLADHLPQFPPKLRCSFRILTGRLEESPARHRRLDRAKYSSVLRVFNTYRLSPNLQLHEKLPALSTTYNNAVDPSVCLCKYDLHGTCNDPSCRHQHQRDYQLTMTTSIQRLRSMVSVQFPETVAEFIKKARASTNWVVSNEEIMVMAHEQIRNILKLAPPNIVQFTPPSLIGPDSLSPLDNKHQPSTSLSGTGKANNRGNTGLAVLENDDTLFSTDTRYYLNNESTMDEMEKALADNPGDVRMWIRLAHQKLNEKKHSVEAVYEALHILSLALESNSTDLQLWLLYLKLYGKQRPADRRDHVDVCEKALDKQPSYQIFILYIGILPSVNMKLEACVHMKTFLEATEMMPVEKSLVMLETLLYNMSLCLMSGSARKPMLKNILDKESEERKLLTKSDWLLAAYYLAYVTAFRCLPAGLLRGQELTSREAPPVLWSKAVLRSGVHHEVVRILRTAIEESCLEPPLDCSAYWRVRQAYLELLDRVEAGSVSRSWMANEELRQFPEMYLTYLGYQRHTEPQHFKKLCDNCILTIPTCPKVYFYCSLWTSSHTSVLEEKLEYPLKLVYMLFDLTGPVLDKVKYAGYLYRVLLNFDVPSLEQPHPTVKPRAEYEGDQVYSWLNFGNYLEVTAADDSLIIEMYETALSRFTERSDVQLLLWRYVGYRIKAAITARTNMKEFLDTVTRCLCALPCKFLSPSGRMHTDFSFHNKVIRYVAESLHSFDVEAWYEGWMQRYPDNVQLIPRLCDLYLEREGEDYVSMSHLFGVLVQNSIDSVPLWMMYINVMVRLRKMHEALSLARQAVELMPHSVLLWKKYISIMMSLPVPVSDVKQAIRDCKETDVNIEPFLAKLPPEVLI